MIERDDIADLGGVVRRQGFRICGCYLYDYLGLGRNFYLFLKEIQCGILHADTVQGACLEELSFLKSDTLVGRTRNPVPVIIRVPSVHIQEHGPYFPDRRGNSFPNTEIFRKFVRNRHRAGSLGLKESALVSLSRKTGGSIRFSSPD